MRKPRKFLIKKGDENNSDEIAFNTARSLGGALERSEGYVLVVENTALEAEQLKSAKLIEASKQLTIEAEALAENLERELPYCHPKDPFRKALARWEKFKEGI